MARLFKLSHPLLHVRHRRRVGAPWPGEIILGIPGSRNSLRGVPINHRALQLEAMPPSRINISMCSNGMAFLTLAINIIAVANI